MNERKNIINHYLKLVTTIESKKAVNVHQASLNKQYDFQVVYFISLPDDSKVVYIGKTKTRGIIGRMYDHLHVNFTTSDLKTMITQHKDYPQNPNEYLVRFERIDDSRKRGLFECFAISLLNPELNKVG